MRGNREAAGQRWTALALASALVLAACTSSGDGTPAEDSGGSATTTIVADDAAVDAQADSEAEVTQSSDTDGSDADSSDTQGGDTESGDTEGSEAESDQAGPATDASMTELLDRIPLDVYELATEESTVQIELVDYLAVTELTGLPRPPATDAEAALDWLVAVSTNRAEPAGFAILPATFPDMGATSRPEEVAAELGFSALDIDQIAVLSALPLSFAVVSGESVQLAPTLVELGDGVVTAGEGEDFELSLDSITAARPFGAPIRLAERDGVIAASSSTPAIESFVAGTPSALDVPELALVVEALDSAGSVSALLLKSDFWRIDAEPDVSEALGFTPVSVPFNTIGIGMTTSGDRAAVAAAYVFADESSAAIAGPELEELWRSSPLLLQQGTLISDWFDVNSVEVRGRAVLVIASVVEGSSTLRAPNMIFQRELVFGSS